jgi:hypothetical protein
MKRGITSILIVVVILLAMVAVVVVYGLNANKDEIVGGDPPHIRESSNGTDDTKTYTTSEILEFSIDVPYNFGVSESNGSVTVITESGKIDIVQNSTNLDDLEGFFEYHPDDPKSRMEDARAVEINGLEAIAGFIQEEKIYFIYANYNVYILSTSDEVLYDDLDQIAKSFRYTPSE